MDTHKSGQVFLALYVLSGYGASIGLRMCLARPPPPPQPPMATVDVSSLALATITFYHLAADSVEEAEEKKQLALFFSPWPEATKYRRISGQENADTQIATCTNSQDIS